MKQKQFVIFDLIDLPLTSNSREPVQQNQDRSSAELFLSILYDI